MTNKVKGIKKAIIVSSLTILTSGCGSSSDETNSQAFNACTSNSNILDLPFDYQLTESSRLIVPGFVDDDQSIYLHLAPFGTHFKPMSNKPYGESVMSFVGFFSESNSEIIDLDPGLGLKGFWADINAQILHDRRPIYYSPSNVSETRITKISYLGSTPGYLDNEPEWELTLDFGDIEMVLQHVGKLSDEVHNFIATQFGIDTRSYAGPTGNILEGITPWISSAPRVPLGYPQVVADEVPGFNNWYNGGSTIFSDRPWVQIEYAVKAPANGSTESICAFELMNSTLKSSFQSIIDTDLTDPSSQRYGTWQDTAWQWRSESSICTSCSENTNGLEGLYSNLGKWFERGDQGSQKNELISFVPVAQNTASYDSSLYLNDILTEWLILRRRNDSQNYSWEMENLSTVNTSEPVGEIVQIEEEAILVQWRDLDEVGGIQAFQWIAFNIEDEILTMKFGVMSDTGLNAIKPILDKNIDLPNDIDIISYDKNFVGGF